MLEENLLVKINPVIKGNREGKSFLKKIEKIEKLKLKNQKLELILSDIRMQISSELSPYTREVCDIRFAALTALDNHMKSNFFKKKEKEDIQEIILSGAFELACNFNDERGGPFLDKYKEEEAKTFEEAKNGFEDMFEDLHDPEYMNEETKENKTSRELKGDSLLNKTNDESKSIYRELMKKLHPDLEQVEALKIKKEELSKEVTLAYENKDMYELLKLRSKYLDVTIDNGKDLDLYLKGLNIEIKKLNNENKEIKRKFGPVYENFYSTSKKVVARRIKGASEEVKDDILNEKANLDIFSDKERLKTHLKEERILKEKMKDMEGIVLADMFLDAFPELRDF